MLGMLKRHEVEILLKAGHSKAEVARLAGVSLLSLAKMLSAPKMHDSVHQSMNREPAFDQGLL
jgi:hypothetical protein